MPKMGSKMPNMDIKIKTTSFTLHTSLAAALFSGKQLSAEAADAMEFAGLKRSGLARLLDAGNAGLSLEGHFDLAYNAALL